MTQTTFVSNLSDSDKMEYFFSLEECERQEIFDSAVVSHYPDAMYYTFDENTIDEHFSSPFAAMQSAFHGDISWSDDYFFYNGCGNIVTFSDLEEYMGQYADEICRYLTDNCEDELAEYFDFEEDDDDEDDDNEEENEDCE